MWKGVLTSSYGSDCLDQRFSMGAISAPHRLLHWDIWQWLQIFLMITTGEGDRSYRHLVGRGQGTDNILHRTLGLHQLEWVFMVSQMHSQDARVRVLFIHHSVCPHYKLFDTDGLHIRHGSKTFSAFRLTHSKKQRSRSMAGRIGQPWSGTV